MAKLSDLSLDELYQRPSITPATLRAIRDKEDFSHISLAYCDKVCSAPCYMKTPELVRLVGRHTDIVIIHSHSSMDDGWKPGHVLDNTYSSIVDQLMIEERGQHKVTYQILNALKCQPIPSNQLQREEAEFGKKPLPNNPKLKTSDIQKCSVYLWEELLRIQPKVILTTSTDASKALGLTYTNYRNRGYAQMIDLGGEPIPVILTLHPEVTTMIRQNASGQMWGPDYLEVIRRDIRKAVDLITGKVTFKSLEEAFRRISELNQVIVTTSIEDVIKWTDILASMSGKKAIVSWDTETTGLDPWAPDARFLMHQFGYRRDDGEVQAVVIPLWHRCNTFYDAKEAWSYIKPLLEDSNLLKVAHNAAFDMKYTRVTTGVDVQGLVADTMLLLHAINSGIQGNYSLKTAVWDFLFNSGLGGYEDELDKEYQERIKKEAKELKEKEKAEKAPAKKKVVAKKKAPAQKKQVSKPPAQKKTSSVKKSEVESKPDKEERDSPSVVEIVQPDPGSQHLPYAVRKKR